MASYNYGIGTSGGFGTSSSSGTGVPITYRYGRVVDVVLDSKHPRYAEFGGSVALGGVLYRTLGYRSEEDKDVNTKFAYRGNSKFKETPLLGEIVELYNGPSDQLDFFTVSAQKTYYRSPISVWNETKNNSLPDSVQNPSDDIDLGFSFQENNTIRSLQAFPGDVSVEGRIGQSIRFSGCIHPLNPFTDNTNNGSPFTIIRNGQREIGEGDTPIVEDVNRDDTSIYLMSDHSVPLEQANYKRLSYDDLPDEAHVYKGKQLIINSGRICLNAKEESILLSGTESVGLNARTINLDGEDYLALDADKIYLGEKARRTNRKEPVVLGLQYEAWLKDLIAILKSMARDFSTVLTPPQAAAVLSKQGTSMTSKLPSLQAAIENTLSKKVYSE